MVFDEILYGMLKNCSEHKYVSTHKLYIAL